MTPVNYVSQAIISLSNGSDHNNQRIFHVGDSNPVDTRALFDELSELGYPTKRLKWDEWVTLWNEKRGSAKRNSSIFTVDILRGGMPTAEFLKDIIVLKDDTTKAALESIARPKVDRKLLETYTRHWYARGWLPRPPTRLDASSSPLQRAVKGPLSGKVAVITGASSGIGAAVAAALVCRPIV